MTERPGIMVYFEIRGVLRELSTEQVGLLFIAMIDYAEMGVVPEFSDPMLRVAWASVCDKLDRDAAKYEKICIQNSYKQYCRWEKEKHRDPLPYNQWYTEVYSGNQQNTEAYQSYQLQPQPQPEPQPQPQSQPEREPERGVGETPGKPSNVSEAEQQIEYAKQKQRAMEDVRKYRG